MRERKSLRGEEEKEGAGWERRKRGERGGERRGAKRWRARRWEKEEGVAREGRSEGERVEPLLPRRSCLLSGIRQRCE